MQIGNCSIFKEKKSIVSFSDRSAKIKSFDGSSFNWIEMILQWKYLQQKLRPKFLTHSPLFIIPNSWYKWFYTLHLLMFMWTHFTYATAHVLILNGHETAVSIFKNMRFNNNFYCEIRKPKIGRSWQNDLNMKMKIGIERRREGKDDFFCIFKSLASSSSYYYYYHYYFLIRWA